MSHQSPTKPKSRSFSLLSHPSDLHCILFHGLLLAGYALAFWIYLHPVETGIETTADRAAFIAAAALMLGWISGIDVGVNYHNHSHRPIFRSKFLNRWFGRCWTVSGGWPEYFWWYAHVVVHHKRLLSQTDWTLPKKTSSGEWEHLIRYSLLHWPWRNIVHLWSEFRPSNAGWPKSRQALKELSIFLALWSIPFWIDVNMAIWLWVLPQWIGNVLVMGPGMYAQHAGCEEPGEHHDYRHSTTFVSRFFNLIMFNIGYHAEHHSHPGVHWSELPEFHESIKSQLIEEGAHVVPFGYYKGGYLLSRGSEEFHLQDPRYQSIEKETSIAESSETETVSIGN